MRTRRGSSFWPGELGLMIEQYRPGDIVTPVTATATNFTGVVREVHPGLNKVLVAWGGGSVVQHDPDEIQLHPVASEFVRNRMNDTTSAGPVRYASRRGRTAEEEQVPHGDNFQGDPETHGIDKPRGGGFSIMQDLQKDLHKESTPTAAAKPVQARRMRRGMYWCAPGRTYRLTRNEQDGEEATCPKCGNRMDREPFTKGEKLYRCPECGFKVPTSKVTTQRVDIEVEPSGEVEVEVTTASCRRVRK